MCQPKGIRTSVVSRPPHVACDARVAALTKELAAARDEVAWMYDQLNVVSGLLAKYVVAAGPDAIGVDTDDEALAMVEVAERAAA
jgi:hypothetical protein